jgi:N12 class adenine-specific DNA methylase
VPSGAKARIHANIAAIETLELLRREGQRPANAAEQEVLACWSGWGAVPEIFDRRTDTYAHERDHLLDLLGPEAYHAAEASVLNAHYTDPAIASALWQAVGDAGFTGGRVLEPGCGSGTFIGLAPDHAVMVGVENDPVTAAVASALYPSAQIRAEGFESTRVPARSFAATVGNVPFGQFTVYDPAHNPQRHSIHNHFILKSLDLTAPGGYVVVLTSRFTLDSVDRRARIAMAARADLLGAVRLPTGAFRRVAGTDVVTDVLVLRRRDENDTAVQAPRWIDTEDIELDFPDGNSCTQQINAYFHDNPHNVLGEFTIGRGINGSATINVVAAASHHDQLPAALSERLTSIVAAARAQGLGLTATADSLIDISDRVFSPGLRTPQTSAAEDTVIGTLRYDPSTQQIQHWIDHNWAPRSKKTPASHIREIRELIALRDAAHAVTASQGEGLPIDERESRRARLNRLYDSYVAEHGPINRFKWIYPAAPSQESHDRAVAASELKWRKREGIDGELHSGAVPADLAANWDDDGWTPRSPYKKYPGAICAMRTDPAWAAVAALEMFDEDTGQALKSPIFTVDLLTARPALNSATDIGDALAICMDQRHRVDVPHIAALLGIDLAEARDQLRGLVFPALGEPETLIPAVAALSGNVREKLVAAVLAAENNPVYHDYVAALREVQPVDKEAAQIRVRPGAPWIEPKYVAQFAKETFGADSVKADHLGGTWTIECPAYQRATVAMTETWGTEHCDAIELLNAACNSKPIEVMRPAEDVELRGGPAIDYEATFAAQAKTTKISEEFSRWVFAEDTRRETLVDEYNRRFNSLRAPQHRGDALTLPGLSNKFSPHPYQRDAVARIIAEPTVLLDHTVGAGKSGSMFMAAMELRRLGLVQQPWIVVPNHIIEQIGREAKQWFPAAKILLGAANTDPEGRRLLAAQSASSDWDMVIVPQSLFTAIGVSTDLQLAYKEKQLDALRTQEESATTTASKKRIERQKKKLTARVLELTKQTNKDTGLRFEQTGCDYLFIDEAHMFKNKGRICNIKELSCPDESSRAEDLAMKLELLRARRRDEAFANGLRHDQAVERVATFATGTPVANSLGEMWVMQNFLRPDLLAAAGVADINDWGATFTAPVSTVEVTPSGTGMRSVTRVGKFCNLAELLSLSSVFTDVVVRDDVPIQLPQLIGGQRRIVSVTPSQEVKDFITDLGWRAGNLDSKRPDLDNILKLSNDGRNVSLDPRLANIAAPARSRAAVVADNIMTIHESTASQVYTDPATGDPMPRRGGLQIVFCDRGTPAKDPQKFTIYAAIRDELIGRGMRAEAIRFIHDAVKPVEKETLFRQCNSGEVSVLIGSTEKMGTGCNVQTRAIALHHVDVPWRPADLEQREGRIIRQGNQNREVSIFNYVTEGTYDTVMWQKVEAKALFIEQVKRSTVNVDEVDDISHGDLGSAAAETKAIATGDARYIRQVQLTDDVQRLEALESAHQQAATRRARQRRDTTAQLDSVTTDIQTLTPTLDAIKAWTERPAHVAVDGRSYAERKDAAEPFAAACRSVYAAMRNSPHYEIRPLGVTINDLPLVARRVHWQSSLAVSFEVPSAEFLLDAASLAATTPALGGEGAAAKARGLLQRAENLYKDLHDHHSRLQRRQSQLHTELADLTATEFDSQFEHASELSDKRRELTTLTAQLRLESQSTEAQAAAAAAAGRLRAAGRQPGWSLQLNPTPALIADSPFPDAESYRAAQQLVEQHRARKYREEQRDQNRSKDRGTDDGSLGL